MLIEKASPQQNPFVERFSVAAVAIVSFALAPLALTGLVAFGAIFLGTTFVGHVINEVVVKPKIYPAFGLGR